MEQEFVPKRGRWVAKMKELGWTIQSLAEETGISRQSLFDWLEFYEESERIKRTPIIGAEFEPEKERGDSRHPLRSIP